MPVLSTFVKWLFSEPEPPMTVGKSIEWWEIRRIKFNLVVGAYGLICFVIFLMAISTSGRLAVGEDAVEPLALPLTALVCNLLYTLGWGVETVARGIVRGLTPRFGPVLFGVGLGFSMLVLSIPAIGWTVVRILQIVGVMT
jgi:hypothetical protein